MWTFSKRATTAAIVLLASIGIPTSFATSLAAQGSIKSQLTADDLGGILIGVSVPDNNPVVTPAVRDLLTTRLVQVATSGGLSGVGVRTRFLMTPRVTVLESTALDGTMQRQVATKVEIALEVRDATTGVPIQQVVLQRSGIGPTDERALLQAISSLRVDTPELKAFASSTRDRLITFYESQCASIRREAGAHARAQRRPDALALLFSVPMASTKCHALAMQDVETLMGDATSAAPRRGSPNTPPATPRTTAPATRSAAMDRARTDVVAYFNARRIVNTDVVRDQHIL